MHLYKIEPHEHARVYLVARSSHEAADIFVTWAAAHNRVHERFTVTCVRLASLNPQQQVQVRSAFAAGLVGICHFHEEIGWTFSPPMWVPLGPDEELIGGQGASP